MFNYSDAEHTLTELKHHDAGWVREEFSRLNLGDKRLNERTMKIAESLAKKPTAPINHAMETLAETKAAYRFFSNKSIEEQRITQAHSEATSARLGKHKIVLSIQDTVFCSFDHPSARGLGPIGKGGENDGQGLIMHHALSVTTDGIPLGILHQSIWARDEVAEETKAEKAARTKKTPVEEKESRKWLDAQLVTESLCPTSTKIVHIADREGDFIALIQQSIDNNYSFVIRASSDRNLDNEDTSNYGKISEILGSREVAGKYIIDIVGNSQREARQAEVEVRFCDLVLPRKPSDEDGDMPNLKINAIAVNEVNSSVEAENRINWVLLTTEPIFNFDDCLVLIKYYQLRWLIEIYHKILKSGCKIEERHLEEADRLKRCIALFSVIAYRILYMTYVARVNPEAPFSEVLTWQEFLVLYILIFKSKKLPDKTPTTKEAVNLLARLGGFLGRKGDGEPGPIYIWRGIQELSTAVRAIEAYLLSSA